MKLFVGLGNPGDKYKKNRHNIGFMVVDRFAERFGMSVKKKGYAGEYCECLVGGEKILLLKPMTYMNLSGNSVAMIESFYNIDKEDIYVICDDMDLPLGKIRLRIKGGSGGHNGLKSIIAALGGQDFPRIKMGIGRNEKDSGENAVVNHVLGDFAKAEAADVEESIEQACNAMEMIIKEGMDKAMNRYN